VVSGWQKLSKEVRRPDERRDKRNEEVGRGPAEMKRSIETY